ncbi:hypothetical protein JAO76_07795 [Pontibacter sp. BT310]|uniref:Uncharacterized protein n=1 Tax=Pontibacter populi TaxID=890055 RepID=A0ABS6XCN0_9BACT|nr:MULTISPECIES: hypothetical protein [Pontibacter]MBJ6118087.1 hypothetical protein [Pontibacter sp. BT310]MBR0570514.1 hypothetical protein [Microvirga sp. STS03]MBW3364940.1 hypothetical protein [Pontibacter populi]
MREETPQPETSTEDFALQLDLQEMEQLPELYEKLREPIFSLKQTGIAPKLYVDWKKAGLAPKTEEQAWTKLSFLEYLWLKMAKELRELGLPLARVKAVREYLFGVQEFPAEALTPELIAKLREELIKTMPPKLADAWIEEYLSGQTQAAQANYDIQFSLLETLVYSALYRKQEAGILIFPSGDLAPWLDEMQGMGPEAQVLLGRTHVFLSITQHLAAFILDEDKTDYIPRLSLLSEEELQVVRAIRNKTFRQVTITFDEKRQITLRTTSDGLLDERMSKQLIETLALKNYQSVELENRGGSKLKFTKEHRRRI